MGKHLTEDVTAKLAGKTFPTPALADDGKFLKYVDATDEFVFATAGGTFAGTMDDIPDGTTYVKTENNYTDTEKTKLSGIETNADVTDAGNVGSTIHGATEKASITSNDAFALIDSQASNVLKKILYSTVSDTLENYFNGIYQALLESGTNIKTINSSSILGSGNLVVTGSSSMPKGHIWGLKMSNATDTANDITISAGEARDEAGTEDMVLASAITKQIDATWAVGTNQGGLNTGSVANDTWYEVILIKRTDTGVVDVMFSTTANRATLPTNYTKYRRIGWVRRGTGTLLQFTQVEDYITLVTPINDVSATATATASTRTLTAPPSTIARFRASTLGNTSVNAGNAIVFSEIVETDTAPTTTNGFNSIGAGDFAVIGAGHIELRVSSTSTIRDRAITATGSMAYDISTFGWIDRRGRLDNI